MWKFIINIFNFMLLCKIHGLECRWIIKCFWNIDRIENGNSPFDADDSGKGELIPSFLFCLPL